MNPAAAVHFPAAIVCPPWIKDSVSEIPDWSKKELQFFIDKEVAQVKFVDRTFNCNHAHAMEIWRYIKEHDNGITNFHFEVSADLLRPEELELIGSMRPGLIQLEIGVQSTNAATITEIHRTMELPRLKEVVKEIQSHENIHEHLDLIAGLPYEDYATLQSPLTRSTRCGRTSCSLAS